MIDSFKNDYYFLSNFYPAQVVYDGICYQNNEAAFQAQKCINPNDRIKFATLNPQRAKSLGRRISLRPDWEEVKVGIMFDICIAKFSSVVNQNITQKLLDTRDEILIEGNNWNDRFWGVDGYGLNMLGITLMYVRNIKRCIEVDHQCNNCKINICPNMSFNSYITMWSSYNKSIWPTSPVIQKI